MKINKKGFTLVELLVVIAIIGILSTVAVVNLNAARDKAKIAAVQASLTSLMPGAVLCQDNGLNIQQDNTTACAGLVTDIPTAGELFCVTPETLWPVLPTGWIYKTGCNSAFADGTWTLGACQGTGTTCGTDSGDVSVDCEEGTGCVKTTVT